MRFFGPAGAYYGGGAAFYTGSSSTSLSSLVPDSFDCAIGGRNYMFDLSQPFYRQYRIQLAPLVRTQADTSPEPGEQSMDPNGLWRRSFEDWRLGAGQRYLDRNTSQDNNYWVSKGVDPFTQPWQVTLLPDTVQARSSANTNLQVVMCNGDVFIADGDALLFTSTLDGASTSWTTVSGMPGSAISSICTDGYNVYACCGSNGMYVTAFNSGTATQLVSSSLDANAVCGFVNGRLMVASVNALYNITSTSVAALPTATFTAGIPRARFAGFAEGDQFMYAGINIGNNGLIYGTSVASDGTALDPPSIQGSLPAGEFITNIAGYLGYLIVATTLGVRVCQASAGGVALGSLITTPNRVQALSCFNRWVYFGYTNYDGTSTGIGRIDLENFVVAGLLPAYCSDRMVTAQGAVTGVGVQGVGNVNASGQGSIIAVSGLGFYVDSPTQLVAEGTVQSGFIMYDLTDPKVAALLDVQVLPPFSYGSVAVFISDDGGNFNSQGLASAGGPPTTTFTVAGTAERFEVLVQLNRDTVTLTQAPTLSRWTLRSYPAPLRAITWQLPLDLTTLESNKSGSDVGLDPVVEIAALMGFANNGDLVNYQEGNQTYQVFVTDVSFIARDYTTDKHYFNGLCMVQLQSIPVPAGT